MTEMLVLLPADIHCTFEENLCGWDVVTSDDQQRYKWFRETSNGLEFDHVPCPPFDHNDYSDTYYIIASDFVAGDSTAPGLETEILSPKFMGFDHPIVCANFWFFFGVLVQECVPCSHY